MRFFKDYFTKINVATILSILFLNLSIGVVSMSITPVAKAEGFKSSLTLSEPEGLIKDNEKVKGATKMLNWIVLSVCTLLTIVFGINAAKKLNDEQYLGALGPFLGAVTSGTATFLAYSIMS